MYMYCDVITLMSVQKSNKFPFIHFSVIIITENFFKQQLFKPSIYDEEVHQSINWPFPTKSISHTCYISTKYANECKSFLFINIT